MGYSATGDYKAAARAAVGIVAGAGLVVGAIKVAKVAKKTSGTARIARESTSKLGQKLYDSRLFGAKSKLFGDVRSGAASPGRLNGTSRKDRFAIGWSGSNRTPDGSKVRRNGKKAARTVFRVKAFGRKLNVVFGPWKGA